MPFSPTVDRLSRLEEALSLLNNVDESSSSHLAKLLREKNEEVRNLNQKLIEMQHQQELAKRLEERLGIQDREMDRMRKQLVSTQSSRAETDKEKDELRYEINRIQDQLQNRDMEIAKLTRELALSRDGTAASKAQIQALQQQLHQTMTTCELSLQELATGKVHFEEQRLLMLHDLESARAEINKHQDASGMIQSRLDTVTNKLKEAEAAKIQLEHSLKTLQHEWTVLSHSSGESERILLRERMAWEDEKREIRSELDQMKRQNDISQRETEHKSWETQRKIKDLEALLQKEKEIRIKIESDLRQTMVEKEEAAAKFKRELGKQDAMRGMLGKERESMDAALMRQREELELLFNKERQDLDKEIKSEKRDKAELTVLLQKEQKLREEAEALRALEQKQRIELESVLRQERREQLEREEKLQREMNETVEKMRHESIAFLEERKHQDVTEWSRQEQSLREEFELTSERGRLATQATIAALQKDKQMVEQVVAEREEELQALQFKIQNLSSQMVEMDRAMEQERMSKEEIAIRLETIQRQLEIERKKSLDLARILEEERSARAEMNNRTNAALEKSLLEMQQSLATKAENDLAVWRVEKEQLENQLQAQQQRMAEMQTNLRLQLEEQQQQLRRQFQQEEARKLQVEFETWIFRWVEQVREHLSKEEGEEEEAMGKEGRSFAAAAVAGDGRDNIQSSSVSRSLFSPPAFSSPFSAPTPIMKGLMLADDSTVAKSLSTLLLQQQQDGANSTAPWQERIRRDLLAHLRSIWRNREQRIVGTMEAQSAQVVSEVLQVLSDMRVATEKAASFASEMERHSMQVEMQCALLNSEKERLEDTMRMELGRWMEEKSALSLSLENTEKLLATEKNRSASLLVQMENERASWSQKREELMNDVYLSRVLLSGKEEEEKGVSGQIAQKQLEVEQLRKELEEVKSQLNAVNELVAEKEHEIAGLRKMQEEREQTGEQAKSEREIAAEKKVVSLQQQLEQMEKQLEEQKQQVVADTTVADSVAKSQQEQTLILQKRLEEELQSLAVDRENWGKEKQEQKDKEEIDANEKTAVAAAIAAMKAQFAEERERLRLEKEQLIQELEAQKRNQSEVIATQQQQRRCEEIDAAWQEKWIALSGHAESLEHERNALQEELTATQHALEQVHSRVNGDAEDFSRSLAELEKAVRSQLEEQFRQRELEFANLMSVCAKERQDALDTQKRELETQLEERLRIELERSLSTLKSALDNANRNAGEKVKRAVLEAEAQFAEERELLLKSVGGRKEEEEEQEEATWRRDKMEILASFKTERDLLTSVLEETREKASALQAKLEEKELSIFNLSEREAALCASLEQCQQERKELKEALSREKQVFLREREASSEQHQQELQLLRSEMDKQIARERQAREATIQDHLQREIFFEEQIGSFIKDIEQLSVALEQLKTSHQLQKTESSGEVVDDIHIQDHHSEEEIKTRLLDYIKLLVSQIANVEHLASSLILKANRIWLDSIQQAALDLVWKQQTLTKMGELENRANTAEMMYEEERSRSQLIEERVGVFKAASESMLVEFQRQEHLESTAIDRLESLFEAEFETFFGEPSLTTITATTTPPRIIEVEEVLQQGRKSTLKEVRMLAQKAKEHAQSERRSLSALLLLSPSMAAAPSPPPPIVKKRQSIQQETPSKKEEEQGDEDVLNLEEAFAAIFRNLRDLHMIPRDMVASTDDGDTAVSTKLDRAVQLLLRTKLSELAMRIEKITSSTVRLVDSIHSQVIQMQMNNSSNHINGTLSPPPGENASSADMHRYWDRRHKELRIQIEMLELARVTSETEKEVAQEHVRWMETELCEKFRIFASSLYSASISAAHAATQVKLRESELLASNSVIQQNTSNSSELHLLSEEELWRRGGGIV